MNEIRKLITKYGLTLRSDENVGVTRNEKEAKKNIIMLKEKKSEVIEELKKIKMEEEEKKQKKIEVEKQELEDIKIGKIKIKLYYYDGEYLSGYQVHGQAADLLEELGVAKYVSGWGMYVSDMKMVKEIGEEFTYQEVSEYIRPEKERKEKAKEQKRLEEKKRRNDIFKKAKKTGEKQILNQYSVDCCDPNEECNIDIVTEYAMPDGTTQQDKTHTW